MAFGIHPVIRIIDLFYVATDTTNLSKKRGSVDIAWYIQNRGGEEHQKLQKEFYGEFKGRLRINEKKCTFSEYMQAIWQATCIKLMRKGNWSNQFYLSLGAIAQQDDLRRKT